MASQVPTSATGAMPLDDPVRQGLADPEIGRRLMLLTRAALGRFPAGITLAQRTGEAQEMFQEVSKHALASAHRFDPQQGSLLHWLGGIVWNLARQRRPARCAATEPTTLEETVFDRQAPIPEDVAQRLDSREILEHLPSGDTRLLTLHAEGRTAQEIAEELHLTAGNVRVRLSRLLKRVRGKFQNTNLEAGHD
ncbi:MAG TPA: sigma-70 family RNA polymerase sigma factor [Gemmataceae bacterium]